MSVACIARSRPHRVNIAAQYSIDTGLIMHIFFFEKFNNVFVKANAYGLFRPCFALGSGFGKPFIRQGGNVTVVNGPVVQSSKAGLGFFAQGSRDVLW